LVDLFAFAFAFAFTNAVEMFVFASVFASADSLYFQKPRDNISVVLTCHLIIVKIGSKYRLVPLPKPIVIIDNLGSGLDPDFVTR
jgi:hypothetical protein